MQAFLNGSLVYIGISDASGMVAVPGLHLYDSLAAKIAAQGEYGAAEATYRVDDAVFLATLTVPRAGGGSVLVHVSDEAGEAIAGATVATGEVIQMTDGNGTAALVFAVYPLYETLQLRVSADGYVEYGEAVYVAGRGAEFHIVLAAAGNRSGVPTGAVVGAVVGAVAAVSASVATGVVVSRKRRLASARALSAEEAPSALSEVTRQQQLTETEGEAYTDGEALIGDAAACGVGAGSAGGALNGGQESGAGKSGHGRRRVRRVRGPVEMRQPLQPPAQVRAPGGPAGLTPLKLGAWK